MKFRVHLLAPLGALFLTLALGRPAQEPASPAQDGTLTALEAIAGQGMISAHPYQDLEELSDYIGARVTGSPQARKAIEWGARKMRDIGLQNVHTESWKLSRGWTRISASAEMVSPVHRRLHISSMGWVGSTPAGGVESELVPVNVFKLDEEIKKPAQHFAGKILITVQKGERPRDGSSFAKFGPFLEMAHKAGALAVIGGQGGSMAAGMNLTHTGALGYDAFYEIPVVSMTAEDQSMLNRLLDQGKSVRLKIDVQNRVTDGPVDSANVVGEIPGSQHPDQVIVVGGHLDSWDLSEGSTDDGTGVACTLGAAEAILASGQKPKRTIRFVLFTGEEQGLLGSLAYTKTHHDELSHHVATFILDNGQGPVVRLDLGGRKDLMPAVKKFTAAVKAFGDLKVDDNVSFGTDCGPFILDGLPGINLGQDSPQYRFTHHSEVDSFDKVPQDILMRNATLMALASFWVADRPARLAEPWPAEKTAKMLVEKKQDKILKAFGLWPFGDLGKEEKKEQ